MSSRGYPPTITQPWWARSPELGLGAFWPLTDPDTSAHTGPHCGLAQVIRKVGDPAAFFFLFGIKRPEVETCLGCAHQGDPLDQTPPGTQEAGPPSPQARYSRTEADFAQSCQKGTNPSTL